MNDISDENNNVIINKPANLHIKFLGNNNVLSFDKDVQLSDDSIFCLGSNSLVHIGGGRHIVRINASVNNNCSFVLGRNNFFNGRLNTVVSEETNVVIGSECLISFGIMIRTADPHLIYDCLTHDRINPSKSVLIGDHCWIGQNALILKGVYVGSGSIIGAASVLSGKYIQSNTVWAGNPAKLVKDSIFWDGSCVHTWTENDTKRRWHEKSDRWIFCKDKKSLNICMVDEILSKKISAQERLKTIIINHCSNPLDNNGLIEKNGEDSVNLYAF